MPYIRPGERIDIKGLTVDLGGKLETRKELCYVIATLMRVYVSDHGWNWSAMSDAIAAVECAKLDFYAMVVQPYEEQRKKANGDVP